MLKTMCGNLNNEKIIYLKISPRFIIVKLLKKILSILENSKSLERSKSSPFNLNIKKRNNIIEKSIVIKINLNFVVSLKKIIKINNIIKLRTIPSFFVQIIKFKHRKIFNKFILTFLLFVNKLNRYFDKINRNEKTRISWVPLKSQ
tara:strand:+ start:112 stop:549 length:438 start_codon:yes stop_codon:yes gene_type:complete